MDKKLQFLIMGAMNRDHTYLDKVINAF